MLDSLLRFSFLPQKIGIKWMIVGAAKWRSTWVSLSIWYAEMVKSWRNNWRYPVLALVKIVLPWTLKMKIRRPKVNLYRMYTLIWPHLLFIHVFLNNKIFLYPLTCTRKYFSNLSFFFTLITNNLFLNSSDRWVNKYL